MRKLIAEHSILLGEVGGGVEARRKVAAWGELWLAIVIELLLLLLVVRLLFIIIVGAIIIYYLINNIINNNIINIYNL